MALSSKTILVALFLSIAPVLASAQDSITFGPSVGVGRTPQIGTQIPGANDPSRHAGGGGWPIRAGGIVGIPMQAQDCGAHQYQGFVGQPVGVMQDQDIAARYLTPDNPYGTNDYRLDRLNVSADADYIIDRIYCG